MNRNQSAGILERLERHSSPRGDIQLQKRGQHFEIISNGTFLMATYNGASERLLVKAALDCCEKPAQVLIGGLGVGFSLAEALRDDRVERATVVEIEEAVLAWNRSYLMEFNHNALYDPRAEAIHADLIEWLASCGRLFDVICLDIDNGPDWMVYEENGALYNNSGLALLGSRLNPGGVATFWSASSAPDFEARLKEFFPSVQRMTVDQQKGEPDYIYLAKKE
ncbi:spermine/spermidine synthase [Paenibacillus sp. 32O-W]|uniref:spermine/spermidine synthase domain-containing protein n=1 Tax=Paenibacillus sp. 32O-W TaxID=1695218 RepID=UPI0011A1B268|nr:spermine/spermidine synthase [Paenibacillus sp. 32O-W]